MTNQKPHNQESRMGARDLILKILKDADVKPDILQHDRIGFHYENNGEVEYIAVEADNEHLNIRFIDYAWYEVSKWDIEKVTEIQARVNLQNTYSRAKVVYMFNDEDDTMVLSSLLTTPMFEDIPNLIEYFTAQLQALLDSHNRVLFTEAEDSLNAEKTKTRGGLS